MSNEVARLEPGDKAPELSLLNQDSKSVTSQELLATPTIFFFFLLREVLVARKRRLTSRIT